MPTRRRASGDNSKLVKRHELDDLQCTEEKHGNIFNLDHNPQGELPMFCRCGEVDFNDEDLDVNYQDENRWLSITQDVT